MSMKMKKKCVLFSIVLLLSSGVVGCSSSTSDVVVCDEHLVETTWKLSAFGEMEGQSFVKPEPQDCPTCYTICFGKEGKMVGKSSTNDFQASYSTEKDWLKIRIENSTLASEIGDGKKFISALALIEKFRITDSGQLLLLYDNQISYMIFYPL